MSLKKKAKNSLKGLKDRAKKIRRPTFSSLGGIFRALPRRYLIITGIYVLTVVLLFSYFTYRWGVSPGIELPGFEGPSSESLEQDEDGLSFDLDEFETGQEQTEKEEETSLPFPASHEEEATADEEEQQAQKEDERETNGETGTEGEETKSDDGDNEQKRPDPPTEAARPLSEFEEHRSYGEYESVHTPSGGILHQFTRGAYLKTEPAAEVSSLWEGEIIKIGGNDSLYGSSVLVEHPKGYNSFYGNLLEVWVEEGDSVSRGENIGQMASDPLDFPVSAAGLPADSSNQSASPTSGTYESAQQQFPPKVDLDNPTAVEGRSVNMHTVFSGSISADSAAENENVPAKEAVETKSQEIEKGQEPEKEQVLGQKFYEEKPLLYLEVRYDSTFVDPAVFIELSN